MHLKFLRPKLLEHGLFTLPLFTFCQDFTVFNTALNIQKPGARFFRHETIPKHFCLSPSWIGPHGCSSPLLGSSGNFGVCSKSCYAPLRPDKPWPFDWLLLGRWCAALSAIAKQPLKHAIVRWTRMRLRCSSMNTLTIQMTSNVSSLLLMKCLHLFRGTN